MCGRYLVVGAVGQVEDESSRRDNDVYERREHQMVRCDVIMMNVTRGAGAAWLKMSLSMRRVESFVTKTGDGKDGQ